MGGTGNDYLDGLEGNDILNGSAGDDTLVGSSGHDTLSGSSGIDYLDGGIGNDIINGGTGNDTIVTGDGNDTIIYNSKLYSSQEQQASYKEQYNNWYAYQIALARGRSGGPLAPSYASYPTRWQVDTDTIKDFTVGIDKIDLSSVISGNPLDHSLVSLSGSDHASLNYDGDTFMTFENVSAINLDDSSNFIF